MSTPIATQFPRRFHDDEIDDEDIESQASSVPPSPIPATRPNWYKRGSNSWDLITKIRELRSRPTSSIAIRDASVLKQTKRRRRFCRYWLIIVAVVVFFGIVSGM